jgi:hypothetical protein
MNGCIDNWGVSVIPKSFLLAMFFCSLILIVFFTAKSASYHNLLPDNKGEYSIFLIWGVEEGREANAWRYIEWPESFNNRKITKKHINFDLIYTQNKYPKLDIEKTPVFIIFDHKGIVLKTYDIQEAIDFLEDVLPRED